MKTTLVALTLLCATAAFGQSVGCAVLSNEPQIFRAPSHEQRASQQPLATEQNLLERSTYTYAKGERPLWEVAQPKYVMPLGDAARVLRKEHASAKKARLCLND